MNCPLQGAPPALIQSAEDHNEPHGKVTWRSTAPASRLSFIRNPLGWSTATVEGMCQRCPARSTDSRRHRPQPRHGRVRLRISPQDEVERQFVWIEGVAQIGEGTHQHGELVPQLPELERGCSLDALAVLGQECRVMGTTSVYQWNDRAVVPP